MIRPPYLRPREIAAKAEEFRQLYVNPPDQIPLDLEFIIETILKIRIEPRENLSRISRRNELAIDSFLTADRSKIIVDNDQYIQGQGRFRFTLAHEVGHWFLHKKEYESIKYDSEADFIKIQKSLKDEHRKWFEIQANIFAAVLLVPTDVLEKLTQKYIPEIKKAIKKDGKERLWLVKNEIADDLSQSFGVSPEVIKNRLNDEQILEFYLD
jgi:Zn-dependent peptidase ImmA (M78 family)